MFYANFRRDFAKVSCMSLCVFFFSGLFGCNQFISGHPFEWANTGIEKHSTQRFSNTKQIKSYHHSATFFSRSQNSIFSADVVCRFYVQIFAGMKADANAVINLHKCHLRSNLCCLCCNEYDGTVTTTTATTKNYSRDKTFKCK